MQLSDLNGYDFKHLPSLAKYILDGRVQEFAREQLLYARQYKVPLLKFLTHFTDEQILAISVTSLDELLGYLAQGKIYEQISDSTTKWLANQLEIISKHDVAAEDITLISYIRGKSLKNFAYKFHEDDIQRRELLEEIDDYLSAATTAQANTYISILKDQIKEEEDFRAKLSYALPGFIYVFDIQQRIQTYSNDKLTELLAYPKEQTPGVEKNFYETISDPVDWNQSFASRNSHLKTKAAIWSFESRLKNFDNQTKWIRFYETSLKSNTQGEVSEVLGVAFDVTTEKEITEALGLREKQLLEAQSIAHIGSYEWDVQQRVANSTTIEVNKVFEMEEMEEFEGFMKHVHKEDVSLVENALQIAFETGLYECVYRYIRNGKEKIIWSKGVVTFLDGKPNKLIGTVQDVTEIKRIEAELKSKSLELEKSNEKLQQFAAIASHDLKEPLRKISVFSSRVMDLEKEKLSEATMNTLQKILESATRMQVMIDSILQFSFIDGNQNKENVNLQQLLFEVEDLLSEKISDKQATIISDNLPDAKVIAPQFRQLFQNLIANALKFSKEGVPPVIKISHSYIIDRPTVTAESKQLQITVEDNGIGFDEKDHQKIFGLFYRLHDRSKFEGSGLGLSICQKIAEKHGARISAHSKLKEGSRFTILMPA